MPSLPPLRAPFLPLILVLAVTVVAGTAVAGMPLSQTVVQQPQQPQGVAAPRPVLGITRGGAPRNALAATNPAAAAAILRATEWLLAHQEEDGRWDADGFTRHDGPDAVDGVGNPANDVGVTGLAVLALAREGVPEEKDRRGEAMLRGAHWLATQQDKAGLIGTNATQTHAYCHAIATLSLCAVAAATDSAEAREAAQRGVEHLEQRRNPYGVWRYQPREADGDTSITTWALMACLAGHEIGLKTDGNALKCTSVFLDAVTDQDGRAGYQKRGQGSSRDVGDVERFPTEHGETMTAAAMWCRSGLGNAEAPTFTLGAELLEKKPPEWQPGDGKVDYCYWFFGAEALRHGTSASREKWRTALIDALLKGQRTEGAAAGSWDAIDPWSNHGGRIYATAMAMLALQTLYVVPAADKAADKKAEPAPK